MRGARVVRIARMGDSPNKAFESQKAEKAKRKDSGENCRVLAPDPTTKIIAQEHIAGQDSKEVDPIREEGKSAGSQCPDWADEMARASREKAEAGVREVMASEWYQKNIAQVPKFEELLVEPPPQSRPLTRHEFELVRHRAWVDRMLLSSDPDARLAAEEDARPLRDKETQDSLIDLVTVEGSA